MNINLNTEGMQQLVAKTIFDSMDAKTRDDVLTQAIAQLLAPQERDRYSGKAQPSQLEQAFQSAVYALANQTARERVEKDADLKAKIDGLITDVVERLFSGKVREKLVDKISEQIVDGLKLNDY